MFRVSQKSKTPRGARGVTKTAVVGGVYTVPFLLDKLLDCSPYGTRPVALLTLDRLLDFLLKTPASKLEY